MVTEALRVTEVPLTLLAHVALLRTGEEMELGELLSSSVIEDLFLPRV